MRVYFKGKVKDGKLEIDDQDLFDMYLGTLEGEITLLVEKDKKNRTIKQNRSLHLYFELLAEELNNAGYDMRAVISKDVDISWTGYSVKNYLWRPLQQKYLGKKSTTRLKTTDIDKIYDQLNRIIGERTGIFVPFPSAEK